MDNTYQQYRPATSVRDMVACVFRQKALILTAFVVFVAASLVTGLWSRKYDADMKILVLRQRFDPMVSPKAEAPILVSGSVSEEELNSEVELLKSDDLLSKVVQSTGLARHVRSSRGAAYAIAAATRQLALDLNIQAIHKTNVIAVHYRSHYPQDLQPVLNALATAYIEKHREVHRSSGEFGFFEQQADLYHSSLERAQQNLVAFTKASGVVSAQLERDLTLQKLAEFSAGAEKTRTDISEVQQRIASLKSQLAAASPRVVTEVKTAENPQVMQQLKSGLLNLEMKRIDLLTRFEPSYPAVKEVEEQIQESRSALEKEAATPPKQETTDVDPTFAMLRSDLAKSEAQLHGLQARAFAESEVIARYRTRARSLGVQNIAQQDLERQANTAAENYLLYARKREEARIGDALDRRGILNVAIAERPQSAALPMQSQVALGAIWLLVSGLGSLTLGMAADRFAVTFRTPDEVTAYLHVPVLAALPKSSPVRDSASGQADISSESDL